jgi:hypothetical protein
LIAGSRKGAGDRHLTTWIAREHFHASSTVVIVDVVLDVGVDFDRDGDLDMAGALTGHANEARSERQHGDGQVHVAVTVNVHADDQNQVDVHVNVARLARDRGIERDPCRRRSSTDQT